MNVQNEHDAAGRGTLCLDENESVEEMSNSALAEAVHTEVWGALTPSSHENWLLLELLGRFEAMAGVRRTDEGDVLEDS